MIIGISLINYTGDNSIYRNKLAVMLESLFNSDIMDYPFIFSIFDNGNSTVGNAHTRGLIHDHHAKLDLSTQEVLFNSSPSPLGMITSRNFTFYRIMAENHEIDYILELHNDMIFPKKWFKPLVDFMENNKDYGIISPTIVTSRLTPFTKVTDATFDCKRLDKPTKIVANHPDLIRVSCLETTGFYLEVLKEQNWEETELWYRFNRAGFKVGILPDSVVYHEKMGTRKLLEKAFIEKYGTTRINFHIILELYGNDFLKYLGEFIKEDEYIQKHVER